MPTRNKTNLIISFFGVACASLLTALPSGTLSILFMALTVATIGFSVARCHYVYVIFICFVNFFINLAFSQDFFYALSTSLPIILSGLTLGICYNLKKSAFFHLTSFSAVYAISTVLNIKIYEMLSYGQNILKDTIKLFSDVYRVSLSEAFASQISPQEINALISALTETLFRFMPSFLIIGCVFFSLLCFYFFKRILKLTKGNIEHLAPFSSFRAEKSVSIAFLVIVLLALISPQNTLFSDALLNVVTVTAFVYFVLGLSFCEFLLCKRNLKPSARKLSLIILAFFSILFMGIPFIVLILAGLFDSLFDLRNKKS